MRVGEILGSYQIRLHGAGPSAVVAELYHVERHTSGGGNWTPIGHVSVAPRPAEPELRAHWHADLFLRTDVVRTLRDARLPDALADWLLRETACVAPLVLVVHEGTSTNVVRRGPEVLLWAEE